MTERQYVRANSSLYPLLMVLYAILFVMGIGIFFTVGVGISAIAQTLISVVCAVTSTVVYRKKKHTKDCATTLMGCGALMYIVIMICNNSNVSYIYAFPMLAICVIYLNIRYVKVGAIATILGIIIHVIKLVIIEKFDSEALFMVVVVAGMIIFGAYKVCTLLAKFNEENVETQIKSYDMMLLVADNLIKHFDTARDMLERTKNSVDTSKMTMQEIADSTGTTAEAIQQQAMMCSEIRESTNQAEDKTKVMIESSENTLKTVSEGAEIIDGLKEQAENVQAASKNAAESSKELSTRVEEVRGIISTILSISSQTNLLALNASIEAARAGEAGRGFAVVAEEIRQLSVQTQEATTKITDIINDLNAEVEKTVESMETSAQSINKQNELIDVTQSKFDVIDDEVKHLTDIITEIKEVMNSIIGATETITDNISHLSATSEEIAAATTEGVRISDESYKDTYELVKIIEATYELAKDLKNSREEIM